MTITPEKLRDALEACDGIDNFPSDQGCIEGRITEKGDRLLQRYTAEIRKTLTWAADEIERLRDEMEGLAEWTLGVAERRDRPSEDGIRSHDPSRVGREVNRRAILKTGFP